MATYERLYQIAEAISLLPSGASFNEAEFSIDDVEALLVEQRVSVDEFWLLDEAPGRIGYNLGNGRDWHWKLRRWRNNHTTDFEFDTTKRCSTCGTIMERNEKTNRLRCPAVTSHHRSM